jgi:hypothetical protein
LPIFRVAMSSSILHLSLVISSPFHHTASDV